MTLRFLKRNILSALKIVWGFVFKAAATNVDISRELFFDEYIDEQVLIVCKLRRKKYQSFVYYYYYYYYHYYYYYYYY